MADKSKRDYPKNWSTMTTKERREWEKANPPAPPAAPAPAPPAAPPASRRTQPDYPAAVGIAAAGTASEASEGEGEGFEYREEFNADAAELRELADGMTGADVVKAILRGLCELLRPKE